MRSSQRPHYALPELDSTLISPPERCPSTRPTTTGVSSCHSSHLRAGRTFRVASPTGRRSGPEGEQKPAKYPCSRALAMLQADAPLVVKLGRLTRSARDLGQLVGDYFAATNGPALLSVSEQVDTRTARWPLGAQRAGCRFSVAARGYRGTHVSCDATHGATEANTSAVPSLRKLRLPGRFPHRGGL
jgi:hypothetical protein